MSMNRFTESLGLMAVIAALVGCSTLPTELPPRIESAPVFAQGRGFETGVQVRADWWTQLGVPDLDALVAQGLAANLDLQQAAERVQRSRALSQGRRAEFGPSGGVGLGGREQQLSVSERPGVDREARRSANASTSLTLSWEADLFGRLGHQLGAAEARSEAVQADSEALRLAVAAEIAQVWYAIHGARDQLRLVRGAIDNRRETLALVNRRLAAGYSAALDQARAQSELAAAESELPVHEAALAVATHRLAVLLGFSPSDFSAPVAAPTPPRAVPLSLPQPRQWMALRPDLRAAEAQLRAQSLDVAAVRAEFMPRLSVSGVLSFVAGSVSGLGAAGSASWFVAPSLSLPIFDHARITARLQAAQAAQREALLGYHQRVLLATAEVEDALVRVKQGQLRLAALQDRARHAMVAEGLARKRFEAGASDLLELLDAQRSAQRAEMDLAAALTSQQQQVVMLHRALGARFQPA